MAIEEIILKQHNIKCSKCDKPIKYHSKVLRHKTVGKTRYRHLKCSKRY